MRGRWRCAMCPNSCATTEASSASVLVAMISPVNTAKRLPGPAKALIIGLSMRKNRRLSTSPSRLLARREPRCSIYSTSSGSSTKISCFLAAAINSRPMACSCGEVTIPARRSPKEVGLSALESVIPVMQSAMTSVRVAVHRRRTGKQEITAIVYQRLAAGPVGLNQLRN